MWQNGPRSSYPNRSNVRFRALSNAHEGGGRKGSLWVKMEDQAQAKRLVIELVLRTGGKWTSPVHKQNLENTEVFKCEDSKDIEVLRNVEGVDARPVVPRQSPSARDSAIATAVDTDHQTVSVLVVGVAVSVDHTTTAADHGRRGKGRQRGVGAVLDDF